LQWLNKFEDLKQIQFSGEGFKFFSSIA